MHLKIIQKETEKLPDYHQRSIIYVPNAVFNSWEKQSNPLQKINGIDDSMGTTTIHEPRNDLLCIW